MAEINYDKCKTKDYLLIGRTDAWKEENKQNAINEIINQSKNNYLGMLKRIRNYIIGYKIGQLEKLLSKCEDLVCFDFDKCVFEEITSDKIATTSFKDGFITFEREAKEEARKLLMETRKC